jgi:predicted double-glycine peptidase
MHVTVACGYDEGGVYLADPAIGGYRFYGWGDFLAMGNVLEGMSFGDSPPESRVPHADRPIDRWSCL